MARVFIAHAWTGKLCFLFSIIEKYTNSTNCVYFSEGNIGRWSTEYCFNEKAFICEMDPQQKLPVTVSTPTTSGSLCKFPFIYRGQPYKTCTTYGSGFLWCATTDNYDKDGKFAVCGEYSPLPIYANNQCFQKYEFMLLIALPQIQTKVCVYMYCAFMLE